jgi:hypothetical protein
MWSLIEMELSLMYDLLYTKAAVAHTWFGYCVRFISPVAAASSLLLFYFSGKDRLSGVDVVVTYILLAGAFFMEATSLLNTLASTWTFCILICHPLELPQIRIVVLWKVGPASSGGSIPSSASLEDNRETKQSTNKEEEVVGYHGAVQHVTLLFAASWSTAWQTRKYVGIQ